MILVLTAADRVQRFVGAAQRAPKSQLSWGSLAVVAEILAGDTSGQPQAASAGLAPQTLHLASVSLVQGPPGRSAT